MSIKIAIKFKKTTVFEKIVRTLVIVQTCEQLALSHNPSPHPQKTMQEMMIGGGGGGVEVGVGDRA